MGDTNLPVVKVYGNPDKADLKLLQWVSISTASKNNGLDAKVLIKPLNEPICNEYVVICRAR